MNSLHCTYSIEKKEFRIDYPSNFFPEQQALERERTLNLSGIQGHVKEIVFNGICIEHREVNLQKPMLVDVKHDFPFLKMHFELNGHSTYTPKNTESLEVVIPGGHHSLFYFPRVDGQLHYKAHEHRKTLEITLSIDFIKRVFQNQWELLLMLGHVIQGNHPVVVGEKSLIIDHEIKMILNNIIDCPISGPLKQHYLEAKVIELLIMQTQYLTHKQPTISVIINDDIEKLEVVRSYLKDNLHKNVTIEELSKRAGINTSKLKKEFKNTFGDTIFAYHTRLKMEYAQQTLRTSTKSITSIATETGYNYVQHFSKAFKKYFGVLPSELRS